MSERKPPPPLRLIDGAGGKKNNEPPWDRVLQKNRQGAYLPTLSNVTAILTHREEWRNVLAFDDFVGDIVTMRPPPCCEDTAPEEARSTGRPADWDVRQTQRTRIWIEREFNMQGLAQATVEAALVVVADRYHVHAVKDDLNELKWDRKPRIDDFLIRLAGAANNTYVRAATRNIFLSAVARIYEPGCQVDTMAVLEGEQGCGKSSLVRILAGDWHADSIIEIGSKDAYQALRRIWIYEWGEMVPLMREASAERARNFISSPADSYRPSYGRQALKFKRQCVFLGTWNPDGAGLHNDPTGARRLEFIRVGKVNLKAAREERAQVWAEGVFRYRKCEKWHLSAAEKAHAAREAEQRRRRDPWEAPLAKWLNSADHPDRRAKGVTTEEVLAALKIPLADRDRRHEIRVGHVLRVLNWTKVTRMKSSARRYRPE